MLICETRFGGPSVARYNPFADLPRTVYPVPQIDAEVIRCEGACLDPIVMDGDLYFVEARPPVPWEIVNFYLRGDPTQRVKIYLGSYSRDGTTWPQFGDDQPDRIVSVLSLRPLVVHAMAERDLVRWHAVTSVWGPDGHRAVTGGVTIAPEQWDAVQRAVTA